MIGAFAKCARRDIPYYSTMYKNVEEEREYLLALSGMLKVVENKHIIYM